MNKNEERAWNIAESICAAINGGDIHPAFVKGYFKIILENIIRPMEADQVEEIKNLEDKMNALNSFEPKLILKNSELRANLKLAEDKIGDLEEIMRMAKTELEYASLHFKKSRFDFAESFVRGAIDHLSEEVGG